MKMSNFHISIIINRTNSKQMFFNIQDSTFNMFINKSKFLLFYGHSIKCIYKETCSCSWNMNIK